MKYLQKAVSHELKNLFRFLFTSLFFLATVVFVVIKILTFQQEDHMIMVTNKTSKALSLLLPVALLISTNMNAMSEETTSTASRVLNGVKNVLFVVAGLGLARNVHAGLSTAANADTDKKETVKVKVVDLTLSADKKSLTDKDGNVVIAADKEITADLNTLTQANFAATLKDFAKEEDIKKVETAKLAQKEIDVEKAIKNGWKAALKTKLNPAQNPFKTDSNVVVTYAPAVGAIALIVSGVQGLAQEAGLCCNGSDASAE